MAGKSSAGDLTRYVPEQLLEKLEAARQGKTMAGERRTVTILFADVQGSTAAAERLDPEEWAEIVNGGFERLIKPVYRYEGTLARLMGDGVLAFFGAPIAHEDDAERAVRAGLAMLADIRPHAREVTRRWGVDFDVRVGVNTGLVVVGEVGSDLRVEYTALGDAVNLAARMEQTAEPGTLQIAAATHRLVQPLFAFESLPPLAVKGKSDPVEAYRVIGVRDQRASLRGIPGRSSPLMGRSHQLEALGAVAAAVRAGSGQVCTVIGEAGVGKSRLVAALREQLEESGALSPGLATEPGPEELAWAEGRCLSYDAAVPYAPFIDLFDRAIGLRPDQSNEDQAALVATFVTERTGTDDPGLVAYLSTMLGVEGDQGTSGSRLAEEWVVINGLSPPERQKRIFQSVVELVSACARRRPVLIVLEDVHWADPVSLALLEDLMRVTDYESLGVLVLMRPYKDDPAWRVHEFAARELEHRYTPVRLERLEDESVDGMIEALLGRPEPALSAQIRQRSEGNPFFVEELVRMILDGDSRATAGRTQLPGSVAALLTARLDRLSESSKLMVQLASVIGREFELSEVIELLGDQTEVDAGLTELLRRDVLVELDRIPVRKFGFRHALIQETAHESILLKTRRALHAQVAERLIARAGAPHEIARHLMEAQEEVRAVPYLVQAGDLAAREMSLADAIRHFDTALRFAPSDDTDLIRRAHEGLGAAYTLIPDLTHALSTYQEMLEFGRRSSEPAVEIMALNRLGFTTAFLGGDVDRATLYLEDARKKAELVGDEAGLIEYHMNSCMIETTRGDLEKAAAHDAETIRLGEALGASDIHAGGLVQRTLSLAHATRFEEGERALEQARRILGGTNDPGLLAGLAGAEFFLELRKGHLGRAWELARQSADLAIRAGSSMAAASVTQAGMVAAMRGDFETALAYLAQAVRLGEESGQLFHASAAASGMAELYSELAPDSGDVERSSARALGYFDVPMGVTMASTVYAQLGWAQLRLGDAEAAFDKFSTGLAGSSATRLIETPNLLLGVAAAQSELGNASVAESTLAEAVDFVTSRGMDVHRPIIGLVGGLMALRRGDVGLTAERLESGAEAAREQGADRIGWQLEALLAVVNGQSGQPEAAESHRRASAEVVERISDAIADPELREGFESAARRWAERVAAR